MTLETYLKKFTLKQDRGLPVFSKEESMALFQEIKALFFNERSNKWSSIKFSKSYVSLKGIDPEIFILLLEHIFLSYYYNTGRTKGRTSALSFIRNLKISKNFNSTSRPSEWLLQPETDILEFLLAAKEFAGFFKKGTHEKMVNFLHEEVNTGLSKSTLRRYYFDAQK